MGSTPDAADLFAAIRSMPESGRLAPINHRRAQIASQRIVAILRTIGVAAPEASLLMRSCELLHDGATGGLEPDAVRLGLWLAYRELLSTGDEHPHAARGMTLAWNAVASHPDHRVRIGRRHRHTRAHDGDVRRVFYDTDQTGSGSPPKGEADVSLVQPSRLARLLGYDLGAPTAVPSSPADPG